MLLVIGILTCLISIAYQDWKLRHIHILFPVGIALLAIANTIKTTSFLFTLYNVAFFTLVFCVMAVYMALKNRKWVNPLMHYFGLGDVLFYLALSPMFAVFQYGVFFIASMVFAIVMHFFLQRYYKHDTIPLAGYASILLMMFIVNDYFNVKSKWTMLQW